MYFDVMGEGGAGPRRGERLSQKIKFGIRLLRAFKQVSMILNTKINKIKMVEREPWKV